MKQKIFLTANTFFGRKKALSIPDRKKLYSTVDEMNQGLIDIWNKTVGENDIVYHLGYFGHDPINTSTVIEQLNGNIIFFSNNTDKTIPEINNLYDHIEVLDYQIEELIDKKSFLTYYPMEVWAGKNTYHFYGDERVKSDLDKVKRRLCVSFDIWKKPIDIDSCIDIINEYELNK